SGSSSGRSTSRSTWRGCSTRGSTASSPTIRTACGRSWWTGSGLRRRPSRHGTDAILLDLEAVCRPRLLEVDPALDDVLEVEPFDGERDLRHDRGLAVQGAALQALAHGGLDFALRRYADLFQELA